MVLQTVLSTGLKTKSLLFASLLILGFNISLANVGPKLPITPFAEKTRKVNLKPGFAKPGYQIKTVVIDPGHGGHDPGCLGSFTKEKNIVLSVSKKLADLFKAQYPGIKVIMTRETDVFIPLFERAAIANRNNADLFISIHCNFMPGSSATSGTETYVMGLHTAQFNLEVAKRENAAILMEDNYQKNYDYDPNSAEGHIMLSMFQNAYLKQSLQFAELVESTFRFETGRRSRGVKQAGFIVLKATAMPSILAEIGFLSNPGEEQFLSTTQGQDHIAQGLISAFSQYKKTVEDPTYRAEDPNQPVVMQENKVEKPYSYASSGTVATSPATTTASKEIPAPPRANEPAATRQPEPRPVLASNYGPVPSRGTASAAPPPNPPSNVPKSNPAPANVPSSTTFSFYVQLSAGPQSPETELAKWRSYGYPIQVVKEDNLFKARTTAYNNYQQANAVRQAFKEWGINDAFIVVYDGAGKKISLPEAKKILGIP
jgi:N-acetylmuramoyl-L-alanine amidase